VTAREDFGEPTGTEIVSEIGLFYFRRGLLLDALRALFSGVSREVESDLLQTRLAEIRKSPTP
jgi:hypothetical protein